MLVAAFAPVGRGVSFLFVLALLSIGLFVWIVYWARSEFRPLLPRLRSGWIIVAIVAALTIMFPPMRRAADWKDVATGEPIPKQFAQEFDRFLFGYIPSYGWIGSLGRDETDGCDCTSMIGDRGPYRYRTYVWVIDWEFLAAQCTATALVLFLFGLDR